MAIRATKMVRAHCLALYLSSIEWSISGWQADSYALPPVSASWNVVAHELSIWLVWKSVSWDKTMPKTFPTCYQCKPNASAQEGFVAWFNLPVHMELLGPLLYWDCGWMSTWNIDCVTLCYLWCKAIDQILIYCRIKQELKKKSW